MQSELIKVKATTNVPLPLQKLLTKASETYKKKHKTQSGQLTLEEQVADLNQRIRDQEKMLRSQELKVHKSNKKKSAKKSHKETMMMH